MSQQHALARGDARFRIGDGVTLEIPHGPIDVELAPDSAVLSWRDDKGNPGAAAIPLDEYERYVREGAIQPEPELA